MKLRLAFIFHLLSFRLPPSSLRSGARVPIIGADENDSHKRRGNVRGRKSCRAASGGVRGVAAARGGGARRVRVQAGEGRSGLEREAEELARRSIGATLIPLRGGREG